jgi:L-ascorbate metabolism protein UlaG (beta-lactamase superfamily)
MQLQLIRSATLRLDYAHHRFIIDPYLAAKHTRPSYAGASPNPLVDLPCSPQEVIAGIEMALISHLHSDHFDPAAKELLPKAIPILCQPEDQAEIESMGFRSVIPVGDTVNWEGIRITRTPCQHGTGAILAEMGDASGFVFEAAGEPTVYWAGDTVWCDAAAETIRRVRPDVIITHSCGALWGDRVLIVMDAAQTVAVCRAAPGSTVIATHMEALDHATVTREALRTYAVAHGVRPEKLLVPLDGEEIVLWSASQATSRGRT